MAWSETAANEAATLKDLEYVFSRILNFIGYFAIIIVFIMLVMGGFKYLTSGGDPKGTESAQKTLTYAILGLVLLIVIWLILRFVYAFTGIDVTKFQIGN